MKNRFKTLSFVIASLFAISVSGASAAEFHSAVHPQSINGSQSTSHVLTTNAGTWTCKTATFSGTTSGTTSSTQTLTPNYDKCTAFGFVEIPVHENGCAYVLHANGTTEIECPTGKKIEITVPFCTTTIGPQHITSGLSFANASGKAHIILTTKITEQIDYNECGTNRTNGSYTGTTTVQGSSGSIWHE